MKKTLVLVVAAIALVAAGCGSSNSSSNNNTSTGASSTPAPPAKSSGGSGGGGGSQLKLAADASGALKFDKSSLSAKAGKVTITMSNPSNLPHGVSIEGNGVTQNGNVVNQGGTSTVSATLKPGKYTFFCPVPGHRQAGMEGTLTVK